MATTVKLQHVFKINSTITSYGKLWTWRTIRLATLQSEPSKWNVSQQPNYNSPVFTGAGYDIPWWRMVKLRTMNGCLKLCLHLMNTATFKDRAVHGGGVWTNFHVRQNRKFTKKKQKFGCLHKIYLYLHATKIFVCTYYRQCKAKTMASCSKQ